MKMDSLKWEVQRLQVENKKLREQHSKTSERMDYKPLGVVTPTSVCD